MGPKHKATRVLSVDWWLGNSYTNGIYICASSISNEGTTASQQHNKYTQSRLCAFKLH